MEHDPSPEKPAGLDRRSLMGRLGASAAGVAAVSAIAAGGLALTTQPAKAQGVTDVEILNFALNLEYLEAEYYIRAYFGYGLQGSDRTGAGTLGTVTGGTQVNFTNPALQQYCQRLASDELTHVRFLKSALGSSAVAEPNINLTAGFTGLGLAIGISNFNPFADEISFLVGAYVFEDVGVTAYNGAVTLISNPAYLQAAAGILAVEAYHAGSIRTLLANVGGGQIADQISNLRSLLSVGPNGASDDQGIIVPGNDYNAVSADSNSLAFTRTPQQVLNIVYEGTNLAGTGGGFFPNGLNGTIR